MPRPSRYSPAVKAAMIITARAKPREGASQKEIAKQMGVNLASLNGWLRAQTFDLLYPPVPPSMPRNRSARQAPLTIKN